MNNFLFFWLLLSLCGCSKDISEPEMPLPYIASKDDEQFRYTECVSLDTVTTYIGKHLIISNPYKKIGLLRLKGSMHNHTTNSDGVFTPIEAAKKIRDEGKFDFYTITDHGYVTLDPSIKEIIWMGKSLEDTKGMQNNGQHLCIYNLPTVFNGFCESGNINELISKYTNMGALINYAHPDWWWQVQSSDKIAGIGKIRFVEVLNSGKSGSERAYNILLKKFGTGICGFGVDDFHNNESFNKSWIVAYADSRDKMNIWKTILRGTFYASKNGGTMEITCKNGKIEVSTENGSTISFIGKAIDSISELGEIIHQVADVNQATYTIKGDEGYVYVKVQKSNKIAISQAIVIL